jgi:cardiolipin synthase
LQQEYIDKSNVVSESDVAAWPVHRRLWNNTIAMLGPLL